MTTALITGAAGFIARHLAQAMRARGGYRIVGADIRAAPPAIFDAWHTLDLADADAAALLVQSTQPAEIFHLVGSIRGSDADIRASNVETARVMLEAVASHAPAARIVLMGSAAEYGAAPASAQPVRESFAGTPTTAYGRAKCDVSALAVRYARERGVSAVIVRPSNVIGAGISSALVVGAIVQRLRDALHGDPPRAITIGATHTVRDFIAVEDVASGSLRAAERGAAGDAYNLCTGEGHSIAEALTLLISLAGTAIRVDQDPALMRSGDVDAMICSPEKAARDLDWRPTISFGDSLRSAWESTVSANAAR